MMNYDNAQQYSFSHGLATAPQLHLHQQQQLQQHQQQHIFQQSYSHAVPTSNVYQLQFTGAGGSVIQSQDDRISLGLPAGLHSGLAAGQPGIIPQQFIKHGVPVNVDSGGSIHVVRGLDGMIYPQQKSDLKIIQGPDGRLMQQHDGTTLNVQQAFIGVDMVTNPPGFIDPNLQTMDNQTGHPQGLSGNVYATYTKNHFSGWLQQPLTVSSGGQNTNTGQNALPSFGHLWSQFQQQKQQVDMLQQHQQQQQVQQLSQFQQQFTNSLQPGVATGQLPGVQTLPGIQMIKMPQAQQPKLPSMKPSPTSMAPISVIPHQQQSPLPCRQSPMAHAPTPPSSSSMTTVKQSPVSVMQIHEVTPPTLMSSSFIPVASSPLPTDSVQTSSTTSTFVESGPPKVTVTLDSLAHCETFPPTKPIPGASDSLSFTSSPKPAVSIKGRKSSSANKSASKRAAKQSAGDHQASHPSPSQRPRSAEATHTVPSLSRAFQLSSTGSSLERSSSESSNFSSPPYTLTPPNSIESTSPIVSQFSKTGMAQKVAATVVGEMSGSHLDCTPSFPSTSSSSVEVTTSSPSSVTTTTTIATSCHAVTMVTTSVMSTIASSTETSSSEIDSVAKTVMSSMEKSASKKIKIPFSWQRKCENGQIVYFSPSGVPLRSVEQICAYLLSDTTCKCGLECPVLVEKSFSFDPDVANQPWSSVPQGGKVGDDDLGSLCNHRREILALAAFHSSCAEVAGSISEPLCKKRDRKKSVSGLDGLIVAPPKRLKTSITNAVNKHAMSIASAGNQSMQSTPTSLVDKSSPLPETKGLNQHPPMSPANSRSTPSSCGPFSDAGDDPDLMWQSNDFLFGQFDSLSEGEESVKGKSNHLPMFNMPSVTDGKSFTFPSQQHQILSGSRFFPTSGVCKSEAGFMSEDGRCISYPGLSPSDPLGPAVSPGELIGPHMVSTPNCSPGPPMFFPQAAYPSAHSINQVAGSELQSASWPNQKNSSSSLHQPPPPPSYFQQHPNINHPFPKHSTPQQQQLATNPWLENSTSNKAQTKRPKSKKDKQKLIRVSECNSSCHNRPSHKASKSTMLPSSNVSFLENPTVFVEQQTAIINNSIAQCHMACSTPTPPHVDSVQSETGRTPPVIQAGSNILKSGDVDKEEEDLRTSTDLDSNKSFSDSTENNDSAYLSQIGSDQERSDTVDGSDTSLESRPKSESSEASLSEKLVRTSSSSSEDVKFLDLQPTLSPKCASSAVNQSSNTELKGNSVVQNSKTKKEKTEPKVKSKAQKSKQKNSSAVKKEVPPSLSAEPSQKGWQNTLHNELSQLMATNNWNIPALQHVLAQYSAIDAGQLNSAVQQVLRKNSTSSPSADFPASSLLSAAAQAQSKQKDLVMSISTNGFPLSQSSAVYVKSEPGSAKKCGANSEITAAASSSPVTATGLPVSQQQSQLSQPVQTLAPPTIGSNPTVIQLQKVTPGSLAMNVVISASGQPTFSSESVRAVGQMKETDTAVDNMSLVSTSVQHPLMAHGVIATGTHCIGDSSTSQVKFSVTSVIPQGPIMSNCMAGSNSDPLLLNHLGNRVVMKGGAVPPVSMSVMTNTPKSMTTVIPAVGFNQAMFSPAGQILGTQPVCSNPQLITSAMTGASQVINQTPSHQGQELRDSSTQLINPGTGQGPATLGTQGSQIVNTLPMQGLGNQLLITNPLQQMSPSNSLSQLSPAVAAQILTPGGSHQQIQHVSPSFITNQLQSAPPPTSILNNANLFTNMSVPALNVSSGQQDNMSNLATLGLKPDQRLSVGDTVSLVDKGDLSSLNSAKDMNIPVASGAVYAATSQPVFVIPQANTVMQVLGSSNHLTASQGLQGEVNLQANLQHLINKNSAAMDPNQIQNLLTTGFNTLNFQQMMNAVNLGSVQQQQQQQQLQMLQVQQLMLQQFQQQGSNLQGLSMPLNQPVAQGQAPNALGTAAIMNTVVPQQSLHLNPMLDLSALNQNLSPVAAQNYQNQLSPAAAQLQHMSSALNVQPLTTCPVSLIPNTGAVPQQPTPVQPLAPPPPTAKPLVSAVSQAVVPPAPANTQNTAITSICQVAPDQPIAPAAVCTPPQPQLQLQQPAQQQPALSAPQQLNSTKTPPVANQSTATKASGNTKSPSKSKSKSKKSSEPKKPVDPESERKEEDIVEAVHQILAQAVQKQRELELAAKNQPPPPPKSKSKRSSQSRAKANQQGKELDLGKLVSISDGVILEKPNITQQERARLGLEFGDLEPRPEVFATNVGVGVTANVATGKKKGVTMATVTKPVAVAAISNTPKAVTGEDDEERAKRTNPSHDGVHDNVGVVTSGLVGKKTTISLKDHLSSIVSKDGGKKKVLADAEPQKISDERSSSGLKVK